MLKDLIYRRLIWFEKPRLWSLNLKSPSVSNKSAPQSKPPGSGREAFTDLDSGRSSENSWLIFYITDVEGEKGREVSLQSFVCNTLFRPNYWCFYQLLFFCFDAANNLRINEHLHLWLIITISLIDCCFAGSDTILNNTLNWIIFPWSRHISCLSTSQMSPLPPACR